MAREAKSAKNRVRGQQQQRGKRNLKKSIRTTQNSSAIKNQPATVHTETDIDRSSALSFTSAGGQSTSHKATRTANWAEGRGLELRCDQFPLIRRPNLPNQSGRPFHTSFNIINSYFSSINNQQRSLWEDSLDGHMILNDTTRDDMICDIGYITVTRYKRSILSTGEHRRKTQCKSI